MGFLKSNDVLFILWKIIKLREVLLHFFKTDYQVAPLVSLWSFL